MYDVRIMFKTCPITLFCSSLLFRPFALERTLVTPLKSIVILDLSALSLLNGVIQYEEDLQLDQPNKLAICFLGSQLAFNNSFSNCPCFPGYMADILKVEAIKHSQQLSVDSNIDLFVRSSIHDIQDMFQCTICLLLWYRFLILS